SGVGDPACDLTIAWTFFTPPARAEFRRALLGPPSGDNDGRWARGRGWALWKSLIGLAEDVVAERTFSAADQAVLAALLDPD
ncbi:MAG: aminoglycoside phosphotransferase, partial [Janthinobacterium lividum]